MIGVGNETLPMRGSMGLACEGTLPTYESGRRIFGPHGFGVPGTHLILRCVPCRLCRRHYILVPSMVRRGTCAIGATLDLLNPQFWKGCLSHFCP